MARLVLIRGLPGSGKSTLATWMKDSAGYVHVENDMFLMEDGKYVFTPARRKRAVRHCIETAREQLQAGEDVVVSNCFLDRRSMDAYYEIARETNATVEEIVAKGTFQNVHGVPDSVLESMQHKWED